MYKDILVLIDCSPYDDAVIEHVKELAHHFKARLHLYHTVHSHTLDQQRVLLSKTKRCLAALKEDLTKEKIAVTCTYTEGEPVDEIIKKLDEREWNLVAMGTHGHKGLADFIFGSVSYAVKHHTAVPVLLVKGQNRSG